MKNKLSILFVDDEALLFDIYKKFLEELDAEIVFCDHPQKAWKAIDRRKFDLIITDLNMPVIMGDEFISIVRASRLNEHTPIILCSAFINKMIISELSRENKIYFLTKPFDGKSLLDLVLRVVSVKKSEANEHQSLNEIWLQAFTRVLSALTSDYVEHQKLNSFELWNFESVSLNFFVTKENEYLCLTLLMKEKTFLKIAGQIQGTQYTEIESEILDVWDELLKGILHGTGRVTFSKILRKEIITRANNDSGFYQIKTSAGDIQAFFN